MLPTKLTLTASASEFPKGQHSQVKVNATKFLHKDQLDSNKERKTVTSMHKFDSQSQQRNKSKDRQVTLAGLTSPPFDSLHKPKLQPFNRKYFIKPVHSQATAATMPPSEPLQVSIGRCRHEDFKEKKKFGCEGQYEAQPRKKPFLNFILTVTIEA